MIFLFLDLQTVNKSSKEGEECQRLPSPEEESVKWLHIR